MNSSREYWAHSANDAGKRHGLVEHLEETARLCREFCDVFGAGELGYWLGLWHDVGKFSDEWQAYLLKAEAWDAGGRKGPRPARVDHKAAGTRVAERGVGKYFALPIHGHHGGLTNPATVASRITDPTMAGRARVAVATATELLPSINPETEIALPKLRPEQLEMFVRMAFSALVDADSLDTEAHKQGRYAEMRSGWRQISELWAVFQQNQSAMQANADDTRVNRLRADIYAASVSRAMERPGLFKLTVPTGGGKTRVGMGFALRHAAANGLRRVVVAVPFITITDQTAATYRDIFGENSVLEHHSGVQADEDDESFDESSVRARLATENWDAPIVVTTTVRLFESMFSNRRSDCRRLHNLARSVIILDEAQSLPLRLLTPLLDGLREFCTTYGSTIVLSTATQPAFDALPPFRDLNAVEIAPDPPTLFDALKRVRYEWRLDRRVTWKEVGGWMQQSEQVLVVVNTRKDAMALLDALDDPEALHLSTSLCGLHRTAVIAEVRRRLKAGLPCRLVSTQVIEAGVDLDFPLVMRALGPFDSIVQVAGRANRNGSRPEGRIIVFDPEEGHLPGGDYRSRTDATRRLIGANTLDPDEPASLERYFRIVLHDVDTDPARIQSLRNALDYPNVRKEFQMIEDDSEPVVVTQYGTEDEQRQARRLVEELRAGVKGNLRESMRGLQRFTAAVRVGDLARYEAVGAITPILPGLWECHGYDPVRGLVTGQGLEVV